MSPYGVDPARNWFNSVNQRLVSGNQRRINVNPWNNPWINPMAGGAPVFPNNQARGGYNPANSWFNSAFPNMMSGTPTYTGSGYYNGYFDVYGNPSVYNGYPIINRQSNFYPGGRPY